MENSSPSTSRKRQRADEPEPEPESELNDAELLSFEENFNFSDTLVALRMMRAQFPPIDKVSIQPFILRSQLYSSVKDRTQVDRELESLRRERVLRTFKLSTGQDDHAIMFLDDYFSQIERVSKRLEAQKQEDLSVFQWFKKHVIHSNLDPNIGHEELQKLSYNIAPNLNMHFLLAPHKPIVLHQLERSYSLCYGEVLSKITHSAFTSVVGGKVKEEHISLLINAGLLTRQLIDPNMYWFAIPNIGSVLKGLTQGRKELMSFLNRRKYKEMAMTALEKKRLRLSPLDMRFHLRDLLGSGHLKTVESPTGLLVKAVKD